MVSSTVSIFVILLTINICFADHHKTEQVSKTSRVTSSTGHPDVTTTGPHTHEEHPVDDPDHSDHTHEEELKAAQPSEDDHDHSGHDHDIFGHDHDHSSQDHDHAAHDHDHPGHDHSETGHDHAEDHPEEAKLPLSPEEPKKEEEVPKVGEYKGNRARRGLWRRRLD